MNRLSYNGKSLLCYQTGEIYTFVIMQDMIVTYRTYADKMLSVGEMIEIADKHI